MVNVGIVHMRDMIIPLFSLENVITFLTLIWQYIKLRKMLRLKKNQSHTELINIAHLLKNSLMNTINFLQLVVKYFRMRCKKQRLTKPHKLLHLLHGYR